MQCDINVMISTSFPSLKVQNETDELEMMKEENFTDLLIVHENIQFSNGG